MSWRYDGEAAMQPLVGCKIEKLGIDPSQEHLVFVTDKGVQLFSAEGDCCSHSWFAQITGVEALIGATVTGIDEVEIGEVTDPDHECLQLYSVKLGTTKGRVDIEFRNSSNGYYGGSVERSAYLAKPDDLTWITSDYDGTAEPQDD